MTAAERLRAWRGDKPLREAGLTLSCDPSFVAYIERGERRPGRELAVRIRDVCGIPIEDWSVQTAEAS